MPVLNCPIPDCGYVTEDVDVVGAAAQLNIHALMHQRGGGTMVRSSKQKPPKIDRPSISVGATEEQWNTFIKRWNLFKQGTDIPDGQLASQLWQCCDSDLEEDLFKDVNDITNMTEDALLQAIKRLAVITKATSVRKTELFSMKQDHGQPIRTFAAKVKGKAQVCILSKQCPNAQCNRLVDYSEDIVKYVLISGICDEEIKKDVLGHENLDTKSLNETIAIIENKEMACRAMASSSESTMAVHHGNNKNSEVDSKLSVKTNCKQCQRTILKFKLRRGKFKEFTHCVQCWRKLHNVNTPVESREKQGAIFDVIATVNESNREVKKQAKPLPSLKHHIFDGTYGWMIKESKKQPLITLKLSTASSDYSQLNLPYPSIKPRKISAVADTGAQSSLMGLKTFLACGFKKSDLIPVRKCLYAANNEGINILGAVFARITGFDSEGSQHHAAEMIYVSDSTDLFYLSRNGMEQLKIISADFPQIGSANAISTRQSSAADQVTLPTPSVNEEKHENCKCLPREKPPARPSSLPFEPTEENVDKMKEWLINRYASSTFNQCPHQPLPMMTGAPIHVSIASDAEPVAVHTPSAIPIHWRDIIKKQLDDDVALGVIEKVPPNTPTTWCHRAIWVRKPDGSPRRVVDFQSLNKHCKRHTHHTVPPFNQARSIPSCTYRSVTDAWNGYHSVLVREEDRHMLTFITEFGRYRYRVAPQGFVASGDGYTYRYDEILVDVPRKTKCVDDTALWDAELEKHWWRMIDYLTLTGNAGVTLNPKKFQFSQKEIDFAGFHITENDVKPLPKYIETIRSFPRPKSIKDIRAWFGLVNQLKHYNKLTDIMTPFKPFLSPKNPFEWTKELDEAFLKSKEEIIEAIQEGVMIFDPTRRTCLCPDWSKIGIGYWLRQKYCSCDSLKPDCCVDGWKVTLAGSRFLRDGEKDYAPIEGEALAIVWALEDSKYFTLGCDDLIITTDHKPLVKIFGDRALDEITNSRIFKLKQRSLPWRFKPIHVPGRCIPSSDATSRNPAASTDTSSSTEWLNEGITYELTAISDVCSSDMEHEILASVSASLHKVSAVTWDRVREATKIDPDLQQLKLLVTNGFPDSSSKLQPSMLPYWRYRHSLIIVDDVIVFEGRIVIPSSLRAEICHILHSAHQGPSAMIERAKATVFWPGITNSIYKKREQCDICWRIAPSQQHLPSSQPFVPTAPFQAIAADYCQQGGHHYLITVDRFSNWPEVLKILPGSQNSGAAGLLRGLKRYFATFGVPEQLSSDGGPEFVSKETEDFLKRWGIEHRLSSAYNPRSNGRAECAVKSMKRLLTSNVSSNGDIDTDSFTQAILQFRNTPDPQSGTSPSEVLFGRTIRDTLPVKPRSQIFDNDDVRPVWRDVWDKREDALRIRLAQQAENLNIKTRQLVPLSVGDSCRIQNQCGQFPKKWDKTGTIVQVNNNDQYLLKVHGSGRLTLRNRKYLRKFVPYHPNPDGTILPYVAIEDVSEAGGLPTCHVSVDTVPDIQPSHYAAESPRIGDTTPSPHQDPPKSPVPESSSSTSSALPQGNSARTDVESMTAAEPDRPSETLRRSTRLRKPPSWQMDYVTK